MVYCGASSRNSSTVIFEMIRVFVSSSTKHPRRVLRDSYFFVRRCAERGESRMESRRRIGGRQSRGRSQASERDVVGSVDVLAFVSCFSQVLTRCSDDQSVKIIFHSSSSKSFVCTKSSIPSVPSPTLTTPSHFAFSRAALGILSSCTERRDSTDGFV